MLYSHPQNTLDKDKRPPRVRALVRLSFRRPGQPLIHSLGVIQSLMVELDMVALFGLA